jgi:hypothetical protein
MAPGEEVCETVSGLIDGWCERRALAALRIVLPAWPPLGLSDSWYELRDALRGARARGKLTFAAKEKVGEALGMLDRLLTWPQPGPDD